MHPALNRLRLVIPVLCVLVLLAGCLDTQTRVTLREDGSGTIGLTYTIDRAAWETGVFDDSDAARPVPVSRDEFEQSADRIDGIALRSYSLSRSDELVTVEASLSFESPAALERFLGADTIDVELGDEQGSWRQVIAPGGGSQSEEARLLADELSAYSLTFVLETPAPVLQTNGQTEGRSIASFEVTLGDVATATEPVVWEVAW